MKPVILTDLDDTLFQTAKKCPPEMDGLRLMSTLIDGSPSGYATPAQQHFLSWLQFGQVIPVTARGTDVLARVQISQAPAICSNGGCILAETGFDRDWHARLEEHASQGDRVADVHATLTAGLPAEEFRHWVVSENGLPVYLVIKSNLQSDQALVDLAVRLDALKPDGWRTHINGNNLAYLPPWLNKRRAAAYLIDKIRAAAPATPVIGVGDSLSDVGFMDLCDFAMTPTRSQFWASATRGNAWID